MKFVLKLFIATFFCSCLSFSKTFETNLEKTEGIYEGSTYIHPELAKKKQPIEFTNFRICSYERAAKYEKGVDFKKSSLSNERFTDKGVIYIDSLLNISTEFFKSTPSLPENSTNCNGEALTAWQDYLLQNSIINSNDNSNALSMNIICRVVTIHSPEMANTFTPGVLSFTSNIEYYTSIRLGIVVYKNENLIYRSTAMAKDFEVKPESESFKYDLRPLLMDSLVTLAMKGYLNGLE